MKLKRSQEKQKELNIENPFPGVQLPFHPKFMQRMSSQLPSSQPKEYEDFLQNPKHILGPLLQTVVSTFPLFILFFFSGIYI